MAEGRRRADVKKFVHRTKYPRFPWSEQPNLFSDALVSNVYDWVCKSRSDSAPSSGSTVLVRVGHDKGLDVLWGNQVVAEVTDPLGSELTAALCNSDRAGGIVATIVSSNDANSHFAIRLGGGG